MTKHLAASHLGLPPPAQWNLYDADRAVGWITERTVGFLGFADQTEAVHAAWVAYRALARRLARERAARPVPIETEPLSIWRHGDRELILAGGRAIATLVRAGENGPGGADAFAFEVGIPQPADELRVRAMAHLMYRTLRKSGVRWALWRPATRDTIPSATSEINGRVTAKQRIPPRRKLVPATTSAAVALGIISLLVLALVVPRPVGVGFTVTGLAALAVLRIAAMTGRWLPNLSKRGREKQTAGVSL
jgi:hypothetical protein